MKTFILLLLTCFPLLAGLTERAEEESLAGKVAVLKIGQEDLVNKQAFAFWQRMLERATEEGAKAVVLEIDTPGGLAFDTRAIIMDDIADLEIPVIAWVEREALSAGAMIAFSADKIYMAPGTTIGSAAIVNGTGQEIESTMRAKLESAFEASMRAVAEKTGRRYDVIQAMMIVDSENERQIGPVTVRKGGLLNLTASEAIQIIDGKPLLADGLAATLEEVLAAENLADLPVIYPEQTGFERFAYFIAAISPLLIVAGIGGAWMELKVPGFGIFGIVSLIAFGLFFFGNNVAGNLAGYELLALFLVGILLIVLELLVLPGGIAGIIGAVMVLASLWLSMADGVDFDIAREQDTVSLGQVLLGPAIRLALAMAGVVALILIAARFLPNTPLFRRLVIQEELASGVTQAGATDSLLGVIGVALTDLRPSGTVRVNDVERDAMSRHGLIQEGSEVRVVEDGMRLLVEPADQSVS